MIGRAAPANPWIFRQIAQYTATGSYDRPTVEDRYRMIRAYFSMLLEEVEVSNAAAESGQKSPFAGRETAGKMKQFASWFTHGVPGGGKLRGAIYHARTGADVLAQVDEFFAAQLAAGADENAESDELEAEAFPEGALVCD
jgi:tRNA-dihydrouridine synthase